MAAGRTTRTARWRRWASSVPVIVALLFATTTTVAATVGTGSGSGHVLAAVPVVGTAAQQSAAGQRPDVPIIKRAGSWTGSHDVGALGWLPARPGTGPAAFWRRHDAAGEHRAQARRETYQGRGPPGRRAVHVLS